MANKQKGKCEVHNGWMLFATTQETEISPGIDSLTGVLQLITGDCFSRDNKTVQFCGWEDTVHTISLTVENCDDCDMLTTWFNVPQQTTSFQPLNSGAATQFYIKNTDDCNDVIYTQNSSTFPFINGETQRFNYGNYKDSGSPVIKNQPASIHLNTSSDLKFGSTKYVSGTTYYGHKIKYATDNDYVASNTITGNTNFVELYIPVRIKTVKQNAFKENPNLSAVTMVDVKTIESYAFSNCPKLAEINFNYRCTSTTCRGNYGIEEISTSAFYNCGIKYFYSPSTLKSIGIGAFGNCYALDYVKITSNVETISIRAFAEMGDGPVMLDWDISNANLIDRYSTISDFVFSTKDNANLNVLFRNVSSVDAVKVFMQKLIKNTQKCIVYVNTSSDSVISELTAWCTNANASFDKLSNWHNDSMATGGPGAAEYSCS